MRLKVRSDETLNENLDHCVIQNITTRILTMTSYSDITSVRYSIVKFYGRSDVTTQLCSGLENIQLGHRLT